MKTNFQQQLSVLSFVTTSQKPHVNHSGVVTNTLLLPRHWSRGESIKKGRSAIPRYKSVRKYSSSWKWVTIDTFGNKFASWNFCHLINYSRTNSYSPNPGGQSPLKMFYKTGSSMKPRFIDDDSHELVRRQRTSEVYKINLELVGGCTYCSFFMKSR